MEVLLDGPDENLGVVPEPELLLGVVAPAEDLAVAQQPASVWGATTAAAAALGGGCVCRLLGIWVASQTLSAVNELHIGSAPQGRHV